MAEPSAIGGDGVAAVAPEPVAGADRNPVTGQWVKGNRGGPGNPHAARVNQIRALLLESITDDDIREVSRALVAEAKSGNVAAIREFCDRLVGKPDQAHKILAAIGSNQLTPEQWMHFVAVGMADAPTE